MPILAADAAYVAVYVELDGALDAGVLTAALRDIAARFRPVRHAAATTPRVMLETLDLSTDDRPREAALRWMESFDHAAAGAPDIAGHLIDVGPDQQILHLSGRPAGAGGYTGATLIDHLAVAYSARRVGSTGARHRGGVARASVTRPMPATDTDFWTAELDPLPTPIRLSTRRADASTVSLTESRTLSASASDDLRALADRCDARVEAIVMAAVAGYFSALCRSDDVVLGVPAFAGSDAATPVATTLPLRLSVAPRHTITEFVADTDARLAAVLAHGSSWLTHPQRDWFTSDAAGSVPVVNAIPFLGPVTFADVAGDVFVLSSGPVDDLRVNVYDALHDRIRVDVEAHPDLYTRAELRSHHARFLDYLGRFVAAPGSTRIAGLDVISIAEHIEVVDAWNATDELMSPATLTDLIEMGMARDLDRVAVIGDTDADALTHGELSCRADQLARVLLAAGVGPESVVGVMTADRVSGITAMLAVLRTGGAVLPLDPTDTATTIAHRIESARPTCVVTDRVLTDTLVDPDDAALPSEPTQPTGYDAIPPWVEAIPLDAAELDDIPDDPLTPGELHAPGHLANPAWVSFRDGSRSAGVVMSHGAIANRLQWLQANRPLGADQRVCVSGAPAAHWMWDSLWPLTVGATVDVTCVAVDEPMLAGPAETTFGVLARGTAADAADADRPVWNSAAYVLDACLRPLPVGVVGELYVAGDQVARGYIDAPGDTSDRFVANPFAPGRRMFRTGVEARRRANGSIEYLDTPRATVTTPPAVTSSPRTLADMVTAAAIAVPDAVAAIVDAGPGAPRRTITYRELDQRSNQWARLLIACDIGPEDVVAVAVPRGIDALVAIWAIAKSGAAFVTVDPRAAINTGTTDPLVTQVITDSKVTLGLVSAAAAGAMRDAHDAVRWMTMDGATDGLVVDCLSARAVPDTARRARLDVDHLAYVAYTAADGAPARGVAVAHRGLSVFADEQRSRCGVEQRSRTLHATAAGDPISILEVLLATSAHATMVIAAGPVRPSADEVARVMRENAVTHAFLDAPLLETVSTNGLTDLVTVVTGRTHCTPAIVERWTTPYRAVLGGYGHSDTTAGVLVLDHDLRPVPPGAPGELYLTGPALARGFLGSAALTATRFVANPWHRGPNRAGSVLYRTGDIVTMGSDGRVTYLGRSDSFA